jgi:Cu/Ag efflux protein CusF
VKKLDAKAGVATIAHEPVKAANMPAMTMDFKVQDKAALGKLGEGKKVEFEFAEHGKDYVITKVK